MVDKSLFRLALREDKEKFADYFKIILTDLYKSPRKKGGTNKEKKGFVDGFMHAGIIIGLVEMEELETLIGQVHLKVFGKTLEERKALIKSAQLSKNVLDIPTFYRQKKDLKIEQKF